MAQAIQHKSETVAKLRKGEEWVVVGTKIERMGYLTSTLYMSDELHPNAAGAMPPTTPNACVKWCVGVSSMPRLKWWRVADVRKCVSSPLFSLVAAAFRLGSPQAPQGRMPSSGRARSSVPGRRSSIFMATSPGSQSARTAIWTDICRSSPMRVGSISMTGSTLVQARRFGHRDQDRQTCPRLVGGGDPRYQLASHGPAEAFCADAGHLSRRPSARRPRHPLSTDHNRR